MIVYEAKNLINNKRYIGQTTRTLQERKNEHIYTSKNNISVSTHFYSSIQKYGEENFEWKVVDYATNQYDLNLKESFWIEFFNTTNVNFGYNLKGGGHKPFLTEEVKRKIGNAQLGELNHMYGKTGNLSPSSKRVIILNTNEIFDSVSDLCRTYTQYNISKICAVCRGDRQSYLGYKFRYIDKDFNIIDNGYQAYIRYLVNYNTGERFVKTIDAYNKYKKEYTEKTWFYKCIQNGYGVWNNMFWYYSDIDISNICIEDCFYDKKHYHTKPIYNITTDTYYKSITEATKNSCNLATKLRKGNGYCIYQNEEWKIVN